MSAIEFQTVPTILIECGIAARLGAVLSARFTQRRICVVTDRFLHQSGLLGPALASLRDSGWTVQVIDDVVADPPDHIVLAAVDRARAAGTELVLGLGGGSSMDVAKLLAILLGTTQPLSQMYGIGQVQGTRLPLVQMPTTAGTGSEVTPIAIVTTGETTKAGVVAPQLYADLAILDATLTLGLPTAITAATGIDAMVHAIEAFTSRHKKNPLSDMLAIEALKRLSASIETACKDGSDLAARESMLVGAMLAGQAFANAPVAAVHALAYPIGGIFHVPHGLSNALVLPHVLRFNAPAAMPLYAQLAEVLVPQASGSDEARTLAIIDWFDRLAARTEIPRTLREVGIAREHLDRLADEAMKQTRLLGNNPRDVTREDARHIYEAAL